MLQLSGRGFLLWNWPLTYALECGLTIWVTSEGAFVISCCPRTLSRFGTIAKIFSSNSLWMSERKEIRLPFELMSRSEYVGVAMYLQRVCEYQRPSEGPEVRV